MSALGVFAVSALHLAQHERLQATWFGELIGHHASLPIALSILYQEYPFALADVFLKRALALVGLIAAALAAYVGLELSQMLVGSAGSTHSRRCCSSAALGVALLYPALTRASTWFVDTVVLRRVDYDLLRARSPRRRANSASSPATALDAACAALGPALSATTVAGRKSATATIVEARCRDVPSNGSIADVVVPTTDARGCHPDSRSRGGRRLLSDDVAMLESMAQLLARRVDALRFEHGSATNTTFANRISAGSPRKRSCGPSGRRSIRIFSSMR